MFFSLKVKNDLAKELFLLSNETHVINRILEPRFQKLGN